MKSLPAAESITVDTDSENTKRQRLCFILYASTSLQHCTYFHIIAGLGYYHHFLRALFLLVVIALVHYPYTALHVRF